MDDRQVELDDIVNSLKKRWKIVCIVTCIGVLISIIITFFLITPKYTVSTKLFIGKESTMDIENQKKDNVYNNNDIQMYQKILQTYADIIKTKTLVSTVISDNNLDLDRDDILQDLTVTAKDDTQIIEITYMNENPYIAKEVLESICNEFISYSSRLISNVNIQVVEEVFLPEKPSSPNKILNITIGFFAGFILGLLSALAFEYMDNTFDDRKKLEKEVGIAVIGDIPSFDLNNRG